MKNLKKITPICVVLLFFFVASSTVFAYSFNPPNEKTDAPGENNCMQCHSGNPLNAIGGALVLTVPETYTPGEEYDIVVKLSREGQKRWGFQMTALNSKNVRAGSFTSVDPNTNTEVTNSRQYIEHSAAGTAQGTPDMNSWMFKWKAPESDIGPITFYAAGNAANNNFGTSGDYIYTQSTSSIVPVYGVTLAGVGNLEKETKDASDGVSYRFTVRNTGNIDDTFNLTTSGDVSRTLSKRSVTLAANASETVTLSLSGSSLTSAGEYDVNVKATSQGDNSKTAEITTTTTILPVYGIALAGVGGITKSPSDASSGVSYTLRVTNTGNTNDRVRLTTSGDVTATLSPTSFNLTQGGSRTVTIRISGTSLSKAGRYDVKVTATSQGDEDVTSDITTTTTILPVYGFTLAGVGDLTTETTDASEGLSYKMTITNNGNTDDVINLSTSGDVEATLSQNSVSLVSGASAEVTLTISADALMRAGEYDVKVTATSQGDEDVTSDITTTTTILPVYSFALVGVGDLTTETTDASEGLSYKMTITNNGNTNDVINLSTSGNVEATLSQDSVSLTSGAAAEVTLTISADALMMAGEYGVKVTATSQGDEDVTSDITTTTTILPVYSFALVGVGDLTTETDDASEDVSYKLTITNNGNTDDVINLSTSGDVEATLSQDSVSLVSGASAEVTLTISADALMMAGEYGVKVTATSQGDDTQTAEASTTTTILPVYGFTLAGLGDLTTETNNASEGVSYTLALTNTGNTDDVIALATEGTDVTLSESELSLAFGTSAEVVLTISGGVLATAGEYAVKVTATSQGDNSISAEVSTLTTILPVYGVMLETEDALTGSTTDSVAGVTYSFKVTNIGNTEDTILLGSSAEAGIGGAVLGSFSRPDDEGPPTSQLEITLAPGESDNVMFTAAGDLLTQQGTYKIVVTATSQGDSTKSAEITTSTTIAAVPSVYGVELRGEGELKGTTMDILTGVTYTLLVTNTGNTEDTILLGSSAEVGIEGSVLGQFSLSEDQETATSQLELVIAPETTEKVLFTVTGDSFTKSGEYEITVTATSQGDNTEAVEVTTTTTITPVYGVAFRGQDILIGDTMDAIEGVSYVLIVTNEGNTDDTVVLSSSAEVGIEGSVLGSFTTSSDPASPSSQIEVMLAPGTYTEVTFTAAGDFFTKPGEYEIVVTATSKADNTETAELTTTTTISPVPWDLNADGTVNILDLVQVANEFGESGEGLAGDVNMDGHVNILDLVQVASYLGKSHAEIVQENQ